MKKNVSDNFTKEKLDEFCRYNYETHGFYVLLGSAIKKKMGTQTNYAQDRFKSPLLEILENIPGYLINTLTVPLPDKGDCEQLKMIQVHQKPQA